MDGWTDGRMDRWIDRQIDRLATCGPSQVRLAFRWMDRWTI